MVNERGPSDGPFYLDFYVFVKSTDFKICDIIIDIASNGSYIFAYFFLNPTYYGHEMWSNTSVSYSIYF